MAKEHGRKDVTATGIWLGGDLYGHAASSLLAKVPFPYPSLSNVGLVSSLALSPLCAFPHPDFSPFRLLHESGASDRR